MNHVTVIGAGLAGSECAWQLAQRGIPVTLREMKPEKMTPAHQTADFAELCCSNSLRAAGLENAVGLLKEVPAVTIKREPRSQNRLTAMISKSFPA